jgi:hypothetical protein
MKKQNLILSRLSEEQRPSVDDKEQGPSEDNKEMETLSQKYLKAMKHILGKYKGWDAFEEPQDMMNRATVIKKFLRAHLDQNPIEKAD